MQHSIAYPSGMREISWKIRRIPHLQLPCGVTVKDLNQPLFPLVEVSEENIK